MQNTCITAAVVVTGLALSNFTSYIATKNNSGQPLSRSLPSDTIPVNDQTQAAPYLYKVAANAVTGVVFGIGTMVAENARRPRPTSYTGNAQAMHRRTQAPNKPKNAQNF